MFKRSPKIKPGQLRLWYGRINGDSPDVCAGWGGDGASRCDGSLVMGHFNSERLKMVYGEEREKLGRSYTWERSFVAELEARGYDISTIQFSIQRKVLTPSKPAEISAEPQCQKRQDD